MSTTTILVGGATADTGGKVVEFLSLSNANGTLAVRALVRNPDSDAAKKIATLPNVTIVKVRIASL